MITVYEDPDEELTIAGWIHSRPECVVAAKLKGMRVVERQLDAWRFREDVRCESCGGPMP